MTVVSAVLDNTKGYGRIIREERATVSSQSEKKAIALLVNMKSTRLIQASV